MKTQTKKLRKKSQNDSKLSDLDPGRMVMKTELKESEQQQCFGFFLFDMLGLRQSQDIQQNIPGGGWEYIIQLRHRQLKFLRNREKKEKKGLKQ